MVKINSGAWDNVSLSCKDTVKGLIKHRNMFKPYGDGSIFDAKDVKSNEIIQYDIQETAICVYADLDNCIERCNFNNKRKQILNMYFSGDKLFADEEDKNKRRKKIIVLERVLDNICEDIAEMNNYLWNHEYVLWSIKKVETEYKQCSKCKDWLPNTDEFYDIKYYRNECRECHLLLVKKQLQNSFQVTIL